MKQADSHARAWMLVLGYGLLLAYGTLFPLSGWREPAIPPLQQILENGLRRASRGDIIVNLLVYLPFGLLVARAARSRVARWVLPTLLSLLLSFSLEYCQAYLPNRVASGNDLLLNGAGGLLGGMLILFLGGETRLGRQLLAWRRRYIVEGPLGDLGLLILGLWLLSQLGPLVPSPDLGNLKAGISPLYHTLLSPSRFEWLRWSEYTLSFLVLGVLALDMQTRKWQARRRFLLLALGVLLFKVPVVGRQLSLEAVLGLMAALPFIPWLARQPSSVRTRWLALAVAAGAAAAALYRPPGAVEAAATFGWMPFHRHLSSNDLAGLMDILGGAWPFATLAWFVLSGKKPVDRRLLLWGGIVIGAYVLVLEFLQLWIPGRTADVTDALVAVGGWAGPWFYRPLVRDQKPPSLFMAAVPVTLVWGVAAVLASVLGEPPHEESQVKRLPAPQDLPPVVLPGFRHDHPRLPAPTAQELRELGSEKNGYLWLMQRRAKGGRGQLEAAIFAARAEPGGQDLDLIFRRLMALEPKWRGHQQAMPVAMAYDWLYDQWTPEQRHRLRRKVAEMANYLINVIRVGMELSPYNVYLYNSPLQALMACSLAIYGDGPEGDLPMRWLNDYWKNRVLPVWRQIMGRNGGWHEGGEYIGIGIGRAVYRLPAMWRAATGEDLFRSEPGIRGFLDFLIYRTRPDGTHMRWGDGAFFDREVPDRLALAIEYGDAAAYSLGGCPKPGWPTAWPWGPLTTDSLCDPEAVRARPLQRHFDGIGMVVVRSGWGAEDTYLTFKAGDNYWSHSHLDQGSFTLFRGGPLIIDSGYYGPHYGSDHHMNYSYQTIAHNVLTVTDPADDKPMPSRKTDRPPRPIANDGGQRRVGSGWGLPAPMDLEDWLGQRETYHTGRIRRYFEGSDLVAAVAELTPAYTNRLSGTGRFAERTRRVEKYWRTLVYDRVLDVVVVYDDVIASRPEFRKRVLFHMLEEPHLAGSRFRVQVPARAVRPRRPQGGLVAWVLFPRDARLEAVGGPGHEFWVDGRNYDAGGKIWARIAKRKINPPEPGRWRVEVFPGKAQRHDRFLVVLDPRADRRPVPLRLQPLEEGGALGVRLESAGRALVLRYPHSREGVKITLEGRGKMADLTVPTPAPLLPVPWWIRWFHLP